MKPKPTKEPRPVRPLTAWAVVGPDGHIRKNTLGYLRRAAISAFCYMDIVEWPWYYKQGYRCVKVRIEEVTK